MNPREVIEQIYQAAVASVDPEQSVRDHMYRIGDHNLEVGGDLVEISEAGVYVIALGKAAVPMTVAAVDVIGEQFEAGFAVTKFQPDQSIPGVTIMQGSHPVADSRSLEAGRQLLDFAAQIPDGALVVALISGGGSALVEAPEDSIRLEQIQEATRDLLRAGASIEELNAVRSRLSRIKGGGLLHAMRGARVVNLVLSDVLGDDLGIIASGPTVPASSEVLAEDVLAKYAIQVSLPEARTYDVETPLSLIVGNLDAALRAAMDTAHGYGLNPFLLTSSLQGEAREAARLFAAIAMDVRTGVSSIVPPVCLLAGGETTVTVVGDGSGGRNTEAALSAAIALQGASGMTIGFLATDGDDADSGAAGAIVDGATIPATERAAASRALENNDSYTYLASRDAVLSPGLTGTNVNDLVIAIIEG